jgi:GrpB-like predicted nucleotidyltransferase (UPF0157 family)
MLIEPGQRIASGLGAGAMTELDEPIHLSAYDPQWPTLFASEARRIAAGLPTDVAIEHIGSTSVPGLLAKPIIDLMLGGGAHHGPVSIRSVLVALGYEDLGEAGVPGRIYFRRRAETAFNIALVVRGGSIWAANLALRDYLRANPDAAREYADAKRAAFESGIRSLLAYSDYKSAVVARLMSQALDPQ